MGQLRGGRIFCPDSDFW